MMSGRAYPVETANPKERKPGKVEQIIIDLLDDGSYTLCGYDSNHMEAKKVSAQDEEDLIEKVQGMMGKKMTTKDKIEEDDE